MALLLTIVTVIIVVLTGIAEGKVVSGIVSSKQAWVDQGTFVSKFCFHDRKALFHYETNTTSNGRWYFYLDDNWEDAASETNCTMKIARSRFSVGIHNIKGQQFVNQWLRPHFWYVVYADPNTCLLEAPTEDIFIGYTLTFLNPDSHGIANDHFGEDEKGLLSMYTLVIMLYLGGISLFAKRVWQSIRKGGPMHEALQMLAAAIAIHFFASFFMLVHLWIFKNDGQGSVFCETTSEVLNVLAQLIMTWMLLFMSLGWTLGSSISHPLHDKKQLILIISVGVVEIVLVLWEQSYDESYYTYHVHENLPGGLLVLLRLVLAILFGYNLQYTMSNERSVLRKNFYQSFSFASYLWFLSFPLLMLVAMIFAEYWRHRVVTIGTIIIQSVAMLLLSRQFLSRSLYWEVSTLSSTTLPFKRDRGGARMD